MRQFFSFVNNFLALLLCKINNVYTFHVVDFFIFYSIGNHGTFLLNLTYVSEFMLKSSLRKITKIKTDERKKIGAEYETPVSLNLQVRRLNYFQ